MWLPNVLLLLLIIKQISSECATKSFEQITCNVNNQDVPITGCFSSETLPRITKNIICKDVRIDSLRFKAVADIFDLYMFKAINNGMEYIEGEAFVQLPFIAYIYIEGNGIEFISKNTFRDIPVEVLFLNQNKIRRIQKGAFSDLSALHTIDLSHNYLTEWQRNWFENTSNIEVITVRSNEIKTLHPGSFDDFPKLRRIHLANNKLCHLPGGVLPPVKFQFIEFKNNYIRDIDQSVFQNLQMERDYLLRHVDLSENHLQQLAQQVILYLKASGVILLANRNPWVCACEKQMREFASGDIGSNWYLSENPVCVMPLDGDICPKNYDTEASGVYFNITGRKTCLNCC